ncbi:hypothetical protein ACH5RR_001917 [Cinchona calisaya]|uniref:Serine-threonine/tyrosine-protein kinase catalytic domain-containing protein n=1 Tax=Cinchona calisaya TaxID=153742 RepID=A0ABD3B5G0_9GENT
MEFGSETSTGESVIVVNDAKRFKGSLEVLEWAINNVVRPKDTVIFLAVLSEVRKKFSAACFPFHMGIGIIPGTWEKLYASEQDEMSPAVLEEIDKMRAVYQSILHPFYKQCMKSEVKLEIKLAAGFDPRKITVEEAYNCNPRWIVLDSHLKKEKLYIYGHVACNVAIMKKKGIATLMPSRYPEEGKQYWRESQRNEYEAEASRVSESDQLQDECVDASDQIKCIPPPTPNCPCWDQLACKSGFPRGFSITELEEITNDFSNENVILKEEGLIIYEGILMGTPIFVKCYPEADDHFWSLLELLSWIRHPNVLNIIGHCYTTYSMFLIYDCPCSGILAKYLKDDESSKKLSWKARWHIALEIGEAICYLQEEWGAEGPVVNICVSSATVVLFHGSSAKICLSNQARWFKDCRSCSEDSLHEFQAVQEHLLADIRTYGRFLMEIITGKSQKFSEQSNYESSITLALALLEKGSLSEVMDQRPADTDDAELVQNMVQAALLCLKKDLHHELTMSEILAIIRGSGED